MSGTSVRREALKEIAREKARMLGRQPPKPYFPEENRKKSYQVQEEQEKRELFKKEEGMPFEQVSSDKIDLTEIKRDDDSSFAWAQFSPWVKEGKKKKKPHLLNTATIWCMARKMIAQEWRKATTRGIKKKDFGLNLLQQEAAIWKERKEAQRIKQEEARARFRKYKEKLDEALGVIGERILEKKKEKLTSKGASRLIEDAMGSIGKVYNVEWRIDGCDVWIEPWEEKWSRQKRGETLPVIYKLRINDSLKMVSYELIKDKQVLREQREKVLANQLEKSVDEKPLIEEVKDIKTALEKRINQIGRLIELKKQKGNGDIWMATVEPWEEMKKRNMERKGEDPVVRETILVKYADGTLIVTPIKPKTDKVWEKEEVKLPPHPSLSPMGRGLR